MSYLDGVAGHPFEADEERREEVGLARALFAAGATRERRGRWSARSILRPGRRPRQRHPRVG
eukprot:8074722-Alexandrium_andersonii.AAC.1